MVPEREMLWLHWWYTVAAICNWLERCDSVDMNFDIEVAGMGIVGTGRLAGMI